MTFRRKKKFRSCLIESLETRNLLAAVSWTGAGNNLLWSEPANWSGGQLPGPEDDVVVDASGQRTILYNQSSNSSIKSLLLRDSLQLSSGSIQVTGSLTVAPGQTLVASGTGTQFSAQGPSTVVGANLSASGGVITLPGVTQYSTNQPTIWNASDGGVLDLSNIFDIDLNSSVYLQIDAKSGGRIDLRSVTKISDAASLGARRTALSADGLGSVIDLSSLTQFEENSPLLGASSSIAVTNSGSIAAPLLTSLKNVFITFNGPGSLPYAQWTTWVGGGGTFTAGTYNFSNLTDISGTSLSAGAGATVSLPLITRNNATGSASWSASNGGVLDLSNIVDIDLGSNSIVELQIDAKSGGRIDLRNVNKISDAASFARRRTVLSADGVGSVIDLSSLTQFEENSSGLGFSSSISVTNSGSIAAPSLTTLKNVLVTFNGQGSLPYAQWTTWVGGGGTFTAGTYNFPNLFDVSGTSLSAGAGATVSLPLITRNNATGSAIWNASNGGVLDLSNIVDIDLGSNSSVNLQVDAKSGGRIDLRNVNKISDAASFGGRRTALSADGVGSVIDLSSLTQFEENSSGLGASSSIAVTNSGSIAAPSLTSLKNVLVTFNGQGSLPYAQWTTWVGGGGTFTGGTYNFPNLIDVSGTSLSAGTGAAVSLPLITRHNATGSAIWNASNGGVLDLSNIVDIDLGSNSSVNLQVDAKSGGRIDLRNVNKISDAASFGGRRTALSADGVGSVIDLSSLTQFEENSSGLGASSSIAVTNSGSIAAPSLTSLKNVLVTFNGQGSLPYTQWTTWVGGGGTFTAGTYNFPNLIDVSGTSLSAGTGAAVSLPLITRHNATGSAIWSASNGGVLDLSNIVDIDLGSNSTVNLQVDAKSGGRIDLRNVNKISDAASFGGRRTALSADGVGSVIDFSSLTQFEENSSGLGASSSIAVTNSGSITAPSLTSLKNVLVTFNGQGSLPYAQWTTWVGGGGTFTGGTYFFPNLINVSGTSLSAGTGATVSLPLITRHNATGSAIWSASNGGVLDLSNIVDIDLGSNSTVNLQIDAKSGGRIDLRNVNKISDAASFGRRRTVLSADGPGSIVILSGLNRFEQNSTGFAGYSTITATNHATVIFGTSTSLSKVDVTVEASSQLLAGTIALDSASFLRGDGDIVANVRNVAGTVAPQASGGALVLHGDFLQQPNGVLEIAVNGTSESGAYSRLQVHGESSLGGDLKIVRPGSFSPSLFTDFPIITTTRLLGRFENVSGAEMDGEDLTPNYGLSSVALSRSFDRTPFTSFTYTSTQANQPTFLDVRQVSGGVATFRVYDSQGRFITTSNAIPGNPDLGDTGVFELREAGVYEIRVYAPVGSLPTFDAGMNVAPTATQPAQYRQEINETIAAPGGRHIWEFDVKSGDQLSVRVLKVVGTNQTLSLTLRAPDGRALAHQTIDDQSSDELSIASQTATESGRYTLTVDGVGDNTATYQLIVSGSPAPFIRSHAVRGPQDRNVFNEAWFQFDQPMNTQSFSLVDDIARFRGPTGDLQADNYRWESPTILVIGFSELEATQEPEIVLSPMILSATGLALDQNNNRIAGETPADQYQATLQIDRTGPLVIYSEPKSAAAVPLDRVTFHFNEPIDASSFSLSDITRFTGPGGIDLLDQLTNFLVRDKSVIVYFETRTEPGLYSISIGPSISDLAANRMDQSRNGIQGEVTDSFILDFELRSSNLRTVSVADPQAGTHPTQLTYSWQVQNTGNDSATGTWWDYVYLSSNEQWDLADILSARVLRDSQSQGVLRSGDSYTQSITLDMPGVLPGSYYVLVRSNATQSLAETAFTDNLTSSSGKAILSLPVLTNGVPQTTNIKHRDQLYYRFEVTAAEAGGSLQIKIDSSNKTVANELYASFGSLPTPSVHEVRSQQGLASEQFLVVPDIQQGTYFIRADFAPSSGVVAPLGTATVTATTFKPGDFLINDSDYGQGGTAGQRTIEVSGVNFDRSMTVRLIGQNGPSITPVRYYRPNSENLYVTFDLTSAPPQVYNVEFRNSANRLVTVPNALEVVDGGTAEMATSVVAPPAFRRGRSESMAEKWAHLTRFPVTVSWSNPSLNDIHFPLAVFSSNEPFIDPEESTFAADGSLSEIERINVASFIATNSRVPGILMAGSSHAKTYKVFLRPSSEVANTAAYYGIDFPYDDPTVPYNWDALKIQLNPRNLSESAFDTAYAQFIQATGPLTGDFLKMLSAMSFVVPSSTTEAFEIVRTMTQEAFDRFLSQRSASIAGQVQYNFFNIDFTSLAVTATNTITFQSYSASVRYDGGFTLPNLGAGTYQLRLDGPAATTAGMQVTLTDNTPLSFNMPLVLGGSAKGSVLSPSGLAVADAVLVASSEALGVSKSIDLDSTGRFAIQGLRPGTYNFTASAPGREEMSQQVTIGTATTEIHLQLGSAAILNGAVLSSAGTKLSDASVRLEHLVSGKVLFGFTDAEGNFTVNGLPFGSWKATVSHADYQAVEQQISINAASAAQEFRLTEGASVSGQLVNAVDAPIAGVLVSVISGEALRTAITNDAGAFSIAGVPIGQAELRITTQGYSTLRQDLGRLDNTSVLPLGKVVMGTGTSISGTVLNRVGLPIVGATVMLQSDAGDVLTSTLTAQAGVFSFSLLNNGGYRISMGAPGYVSRVSVLRLNDEVFSQQFILETESVLTGVVSGGQGGTVVLYKGDQPVRWATIDEQGKYSFFNLLAGEYQATVHHDVALFPTVPLTTTAGQQITQNFNPVAGSLSGTVNDRNGRPIANATVIASAIHPVTQLRMDRHTLTSQDGRYAFIGIGTSTTAVTVFAENFAQNAQVFLPNVSNTVDLVVSPGVMLTGTVSDAYGTPILGAKIYIVRDGVELSIPIATDTGLLGNWRAMVEPGDYELIVVSDLYVPRILKTTISSTNTVSAITLDSVGASIQGAVKLDGLLSGFATLEVVYRGVSLATVQSDRDGKFEIKRLPTGTFAIRASSRNSTVTQTQVQLTGTASRTDFELVTVESGQIAVLNFDNSNINTEGENPGSGESDDRVVPPELIELRSEVSQLRDNLYKLDEYFDQVRAIPWQSIPTSFSIPNKPDCFCNSANTKGWYSTLVDERRALFVEAAKLAVLRLAAGTVDAKLLDAAIGARVLAVTGIYWADSSTDELTGLFLSLPAGVISKYAGGTYGWPLYIVQAFIGIVQMTPVIEINLNIYRSTTGLMESNKHQFNSTVEQFRDRVLEYEQLVEAYEQMRLEESQNSHIPHGPLGASISLPKGAGMTVDLLSASDRQALAQLSANGVSWRFRALSTPPGSGVTITPSGYAIVGDGDCGNFTVPLELILECDDSGFLGFFKSTKVITGAFTLVRTPIVVPFNIFCGGEKPEDTPCYKYALSVSGDCGSLDPNDILGPAGVGDENWVAHQRFDYTVRFENDPEKATAPAAVVLVTQTLDSNLEFSTFRFGTYGFGDYVFNEAVGQPSHQKRIDLRSTLGIYVDVRAMFDATTGQIRFELESIDPQTGLIPFSPLLGFLPPNREGSQGEGFFNYSVSPKVTLTTGTPIDAEARIFFDVNDPIDTPEIFHTIDVGAPASSIQPLVSVTRSINFTVNWEAIDDGNGITGSAPASYDIFVSKNSGPFEVWLTRTSDTSAIFQGVSGETYAFYSLATDNVGIRETKTPSAEATTQVIAGSIWQNPDEPLDVNDDGFVTAIDALLIINYLNSNLPRFLPDSTTLAPPFVDASGDENVSPIDALLVINRLNQQVAAEGEPSFTRNFSPKAVVNMQGAADMPVRETSRKGGGAPNLDEELLDLLVIEQLSKKGRKGLKNATMRRD